MSVLSARRRDSLNRTRVRSDESGIRSTDVFIAGYPKSGMMWMEFLLTHAVLERQASDLVTLRSINDYIPNLAHLGPGDPLPMHLYTDRPEPRVFFTHTPFDPRLLDATVVYMLRDPRAVMVSYYHYHQDRYSDFTQTLDEFLAQETYYPCCWDEHVRGWMFDRDLPDNVVVTRYEELKADPARGLRKILKTAGAAFSDEDVARAVEQSSLDQMRRVEAQFPVARSSRAPRQWFVRKGQAHGWREELTDSQICLIERRFGETARRAGYMPTGSK